MIFSGFIKDIQNHKINDRWLVIIGAPMLGILMVVMPLILSNKYLSELNLSVTIGISVLFSAICWIGCRHIVFTLWKIFPWDKKPRLHLLFEIPGIFLWVTFLGFVFSFCITVIIFHKTFYFNGIFWYNVLIANFIAFFVTTIHEGIFFYFQWKYNIQRSEDLEKSTYEAQYEILRSQVNPHFLFNSLNTLAA
ncbi:MAG: histidine kinase, partial [Bacteroidota bacterium]|nr:histidine kinase [Bacteroidota bacterium]